MKIKKQYHRDSAGLVLLFDDSGRAVGVVGDNGVRTGVGEPRVSHVEVAHTGCDREQNFSHRLVESGVADGWVVDQGNRLIINTDSEPLTYDVLRRPGYYCASTGERIPVSEAAWARFVATRQSDMCRRQVLAWLQARGLEEADYEVTHAYECVLDEALHQKYRAVQAPTGDKVAAYTQEA